MLARIVGVHNGRISYWLKDEQRPRPQHMKRLVMLAVLADMVEMLRRKTRNDLLVDDMTNEEWYLRDVCE